MRKRSVRSRAATASRLLLLRSEALYRLGRRILILSRYLERRPHEADFEAFATLFEARDGILLDVGANGGQSALSFRLFDKQTPILSIEPNRQHATDLRILKRIIPRFDFLICAAGDENTERTLFIPCVRGVGITGEASFSKEAAQSSHWQRTHLHASAPSEVTVREQRVAVRRLDDLDLVTRYVKIDVEGAELSVLRGLERTITTHRPVMLIERTGGFDGVASFLTPLGYRPYAFDRDHGRLEAYRDDHATQNVFWVHGDSLPAELTVTRRSAQLSPSV